MVENEGSQIPPASSSPTGSADQRGPASQPAGGSADPWSLLVRDLGVQPPPEAEKRRRAAVEHEVASPVVEANFPSAVRGDWNALAAELGVASAAAKPVSPPPAASKTPPAAASPPARGERGGRRGKPRASEADVAQIELTPLPSGSAFDEPFQETASVDATAGAAGTNRQTGDAETSPTEADAAGLSETAAGLSGDAARTAFEALFEAGSFSALRKPGSESPSRQPPTAASPPAEPPRRTSAERPREDRSGERRDRRGAPPSPSSEPVKTPATTVEGDEEEGSAPRRRGRRRRGRGRGRGVAAGPEVVDAANRVAPEDAEAGAAAWREEFAEEDSEREDLEPAAAEAVWDEEQSSDEVGEAKPAKRRRRRRSRRRGGEGAGDQQPTDAVRPTPRKAEAEEDEDDDDEEDASYADASSYASPRRSSGEPSFDDEEDDLDEEGELRGKAVHRNIPTWEETLAVIIDGNLASRKTAPQRTGGSRGRGRGGRGRRRS
jgi:ribonuclease E